MSVTLLPCLAQDGVGQLVADVGPELATLTLTLYDDGPETEPSLTIEVSTADLARWCDLVRDDCGPTEVSR